MDQSFTSGLFLTAHAVEQCSARGIPMRFVEFALDFGTEIHVNDSVHFCVGANDIPASQKRSFDRAVGLEVVVVNGWVVTAYWSRNSKKSVNKPRRTVQFYR